MIKLKPISQERSQLISSWYKNDKEGKRRIGSYGNIDRWLKLLDVNSRWGWMVLNNEIPIGFLDLERIEKTRGALAFYIAPDFRRRGYSRHLIEEAVKIANAKQMRSLYAGIEKDNIASIKAVKEVGFVQVGVDKDSMLEFELNVNKTTKRSKHNQV